MLEVNFPLPYLRKTDAFLEGSKAGNFVKLTFVYAKFIGPGSFYLNFGYREQFGTEITSDGDVWTKYLHSFRIGYNWVVKEDKLNIIVDYNNETNEFATQPGGEVHKSYNTFEASTEWVVSKHLTLGPGIEVGLDGRDETPIFGFGCLMLFE